jgi:anti-anti-sigma factor
MPGKVLTLSIAARDSVTVLVLEGEIDALSVDELNSALGKAADRGRPVIIDVGNLGYIDSSVFRAIYQASEHLPISFVVPAGSVLSRTIRLAGTSAKIPIFPDIDTASAQAASLKTGPES